MIIETDIGRDPDDFYTIAYLLSKGIKIDAITITPGDPDQIAVAKFFNTYFSLDIPIGVPSLSRNKRSSGGIHYKLLDKYKLPKEAQADGLGKDIIKEKFTQDSDILILGPCSNIGQWLNENQVEIKMATMQGGFLPCDKEKFKGMTEASTFNLGGDPKSSNKFLSAKASRRQMCGKNVCHFIILDQYKRNKFSPKNGLLYELTNLYTEGSKEKKMHDLVAAICHLYPEIATWVRGKTVQTGYKWTTDLNNTEDYILSDLNEEKFWSIVSE